MPIGVPKVEYRLPGEPEADWIDLYNCLYRERMLFLCQDLGDEVANQLISLMLYLNAEDPSQPFFMYINSLGGSVTCGIGVYDIMRYLESGITTICMGTASSMASFVLAGGTYGRRLSLPHGRIMIHQPEGGSDGQASEILSESSEVSRIRKQIGLIYANRTQQSIERIARDMDRDQFMSADEAKSYGLIDFVARTITDPGVDMLKLLSDASVTPKPFRDLAAAQSMEEARQAIRDLPESQTASDGEELPSFRTFFVNGLQPPTDGGAPFSLETEASAKTFLQAVTTELGLADVSARLGAEPDTLVDWFTVDPPEARKLADPGNGNSVVPHASSDEDCEASTDLFLLPDVLVVDGDDSLLMVSTSSRPTDGSPAASDDPIDDNLPVADVIVLGPNAQIPATNPRAIRQVPQPINLNGNGRIRRVSTPPPAVESTSGASITSSPVSSVPPITTTPLTSTTPEDKRGTLIEASEK